MIGASASLIERASAFLESRSNFFRDVITVLTGTVASRVIVLLALPFLARIYTPADFGALALFMTINNIITSVAMGRYEMAVVLPREDRDSAHLLLACIGLATVTSMLTSVAFWFWADDLTRILGSPELFDWLWLSPAVIWSVSLFNVLRSWASRMGIFGGISRANIGGTATTMSVQLALGYLQKLGIGGLIIGQAVGQVAHFLILLKEVAHGIASSIGRNLKITRALALLGRYRRFPIYDCGASLLNACSRELPVLLLGVFFSATVVGYYSMGRRALAMPLQVIGNSIAQVFFPKAKQQLEKGKLDELAGSIVRKLSVVGITPMLLITISAPELIAVLLGEAWIPSGIYFQWISIWLLSVFITAPLVQLFNVLERQQERLIYQAIQMVGRIVSLGYGGLQDDPVLAVALFCVSSAVVHYANCVWILYRTGVRPLSTVGILLSEFAKAAPLIAVVALLKWFWGGTWLVIAAFTVAGLAFVGLRFRGLFGRDV